MWFLNKVFFTNFVLVFSASSLKKMTKVIFCNHCCWLFFSSLIIPDWLQYQIGAPNAWAGENARQVHKSTDTLLAVPQYSDLLDDQDHEDESERG